MNPSARIWMIVCIFGCQAIGAPIPSWPAFRGPNASGISDEAKPPITFGPDENVLWKIDVPSSPSSPCIWGDRIFLTTFAEGKLETRCYQRDNGKLLWTRVAPATKLEEFYDPDGSPAASTPATDGRQVVSYFGSVGLVCYDFSGNELWQHALPTAETTGNFGSGGSPMIAGDLVLVNRDQAQNSSLLAVHLTSGKKAWETDRPDSLASFGTPILWEHDHIREVVMSGSTVLKGYDLKTGTEQWVVKRVPSFTCTTPVLGGGDLFFAGWSPGKSDSPWPSWESFLEKNDKNHDGIISREELGPDSKFLKMLDYDKDGKLTSNDWDLIKRFQTKGENVLLAVKPGGHGDITETHVAWRFTRGLPYVPSPLYYQGRVYIVKEGGLISSLDAKTGKPFYAQERLDALGNYYTSPVAADGRIYVASVEGKVTVLQAGGDKPKILHQVDFSERMAATPALIEDKLYLRTATKLYALGSNK
jgi:outer membrane protein assembly factor BamB